MTTLQYRRDGTAVLISPIPRKAGMATTEEGAILATELLRFACRERNQGQIIGIQHEDLAVPLDDGEMELAIRDIRSHQQGNWDPWASLSQLRSGEWRWSLGWPQVSRAICEHAVKVDTPSIPGPVVSAIQAGASDAGAAFTTYVHVARQCARLGWCALPQAMFAEDSGMSVRKVRRALQELSGDLEVLVRQDFRGFCSEYLLPPDLLG